VHPWSAAGGDGKVTGTQEEFSAPGTGWTSALGKVAFSLGNRLPGWKRCPGDSHIREGETDSLLAFVSFTATSFF